MTNSIAWSTDDLISQYEYTSSGHFFSPDTMRFFRSRVTSNYKRLDDFTAAFITTEQCPWAAFPRLATIRIAKLETYTREDGRDCAKINISTLGDFNKLTLAQAKSRLKKLELGDI